MTGAGMMSIAVTWVSADGENYQAMNHISAFCPVHVIPPFYKTASQETIYPNSPLRSTLCTDRISYSSFMSF